MSECKRLSEISGPFMPRKISVIMPVYNAQKTLRASLNSILSQTFQDFELVIIDDGSTDSCLDILSSYNEKRIRLISLGSNHGLIYSLNLAISLSTGEYIARQDADDISHPTRLERQVYYLDRNPDKALCGTWFKTIGDVRFKRICPPIKAGEVKALLLFHSPIGHPTVMIRKSCLEKFKLDYDSDYKYAEDYDLWTKIADHFEISNIPEFLVDYRIHQNQSSEQFKNEQRETANRVRIRELHKFYPIANSDEEILHLKICNHDLRSSKEILKKAESWLLKLLEVNTKTRHYSKEAFENVISREWINICANSAPKIWSIIKYWKSPLSRNPFTDLSGGIRFCVKWLWCGYSNESEQHSVWRDETD